MHIHISFDSPKFMCGDPFQIDHCSSVHQEGLLKEGDLDLRAITVFASLNENLQSRVLNHMAASQISLAGCAERTFGNGDNEFNITLDI